MIEIEVQSFNQEATFGKLRRGYVCVVSLRKCMSPSLGNRKKAQKLQPQYLN